LTVAIENYQEVDVHPLDSAHEKEEMMAASLGWV
jgi:hypothetical protein